MDLLQVVVSGLLLGGVYALFAAGLNMIFGVLRVINLAHGELLMLGAYLAWWLHNDGGVNPLAALPVAALAVRRPARWTRSLERVTYASNALPGVVIALALVFFAARYAPGVYQTLALLVFAYVVRFLPQAVSAAHNALGSVDPHLEEAARGLGRRPTAAFAAVTVPLVAPSLLAGGALVFLSTMKELPATLLLRPIGFDTLATEVWSATSVSAYSRAAPAALALVLVAAPIVLRLVARPEERTARTEALGSA